MLRSGVLQNGFQFHLFFLFQIYLSFICPLCLFCSEVEVFDERLPMSWGSRFLNNNTVFLAFHWIGALHSDRSLVKNCASWWELTGKRFFTCLRFNPFHTMCCSVLHRWSSNLQLFQIFLWCQPYSNRNLLFPRLSVSLYYLSYRQSSL